MQLPYPWPHFSVLLYNLKGPKESMVLQYIPGRDLANKYDAKYMEDQLLIW